MMFVAEHVGLTSTQRLDKTSAVTGTTATKETQMPDPPRYPSTGDDTGAAGQPGHSSIGAGDSPAASRPRWVITAAIIIVAALVALMIVLHITGTFGPGTHG